MFSECVGWQWLEDCVLDSTLAENLIFHPLPKRYPGSSLRTRAKGMLMPSNGLCLSEWEVIDFPGNLKIWETDNRLTTSDCRTTYLQFEDSIVVNCDGWAICYGGRYHGGRWGHQCGGWWRRWGRGRWSWESKGKRLSPKNRAKIDASSDYSYKTHAQRSSSSALGLQERFQDLGSGLKLQKLAGGSKAFSISVWINYRSPGQTELQTLYHNILKNLPTMRLCTASSLFWQGLGSFDRFPNAAMLLYQFPICGNCNRFRYVGLSVGRLR